jgi:hypothetical protein
MNYPDIPKGAIIISRISGHYKQYGRTAGEEKNYGYIVKLPTGVEVAYIWCNSVYTIIDKEKINCIKEYMDQELTWFYGKN